LSTEWATSAFVERPGMLPFGGFMSWLGTFTWSPGILVLFTFLILLFPDGHLPSRRWRPVAWLSGVALFLVIVPIAVTGWAVRGPSIAALPSAVAARSGWDPADPRRGGSRGSEVPPVRHRRRDPQDHRAGDDRGVHHLGVYGAGRRPDPVDRLGRGKPGERRA